MRELRVSEVVIAVVDDDPSVRRGLERLIRSVGWQAEIFTSVPELLALPRTEAPHCLVLESQLPNLSRINLQTHIGQGLACLKDGSFVAVSGVCDGRLPSITGDNAVL